MKIVLKYYKKGLTNRIFYYIFNMRLKINKSEGRKMIKFGKLTDYLKAKQMLDKEKIIYFEVITEFIRKCIAGDGKTEILSISKLSGTNWVFRFNPHYFKQA